MSWSSVFHLSSRHNIVCLLVYNESVVWIDAPDVVVFLLSSDDEDLVLCLDGCELCRQFLSIPDLNALSSLGTQLMDVQLSVLLIKVVESWSWWCKNVVWVEADHIVEEASELVYFALDLDVWSWVFCKEAIVLGNLVLQLLQLLLELLNHSSLLENVYEFGLLNLQLHNLDVFLNLTRENIQSF